jgi:hypothetical protein
MNEERIMPDRVGKWLGLESQYAGPILVTRAVDVSDLCSLWFVTAGNTAVIEYGVLSNGTLVCHFLTMFRDCPTSCVISALYEYQKMTRKAHADFRSFADYWGPSTVELMNLVLQYAPMDTLTLVA